MRTGDTVRDGQGNGYQIGQQLGRGLWGKSFLARRESSDQVFVLKVPLGPEDARGDAAAPDSIFAASRDALMEEARLYEQGRLPFLPRVEARFNAGDGQTVILLPRYVDSLERRIQQGLAIGALIDVLLQVCVHVRALGASGVSGASLHGGLRPSNILFTETGEVVLSDIAVPTVRRGGGDLQRQRPREKHAHPFCEATRESRVAVFGLHARGQPVFHRDDRAAVQPAGGVRNGGLRAGDTAPEDHRQRPGVDSG